MLKNDETIINLAKVMEFVYLGGMRIMDEFVTLTQLSEEEREKAYCKYQTIESFLNGSSNLKSIAKKSSIPVRTLGLWVKNTEPMV